MQEEVIELMQAGMIKAMMNEREDVQDDGGSVMGSVKGWP
jgi:hypothetical protein